MERCVCRLHAGARIRPHASRDRMYLYIARARAAPHRAACACSALASSCGLPARDLSHLRQRRSERDADGLRIRSV